MRRDEAVVRGGNSSRPHPFAAAVACSYSCGWSMAVGAWQGRAAAVLGHNHGRRRAAGRHAPTGAADAGEGREESGEVLTGGATHLLGDQGARWGGGEGQLQGKSVEGAEGIRSRERHPEEGAGVGRNRAVNGRTGGAAIEARGSKVEEALRVGSRTIADAAAARPSSGAPLQGGGPARARRREERRGGHARRSVWIR